MELEPGPFAAHAPLPLGPRIVNGPTFLSEAVPLVEALRGITAGLGAPIGALAATEHAGLDPAYDQDFARAHDALAAFESPIHETRYADAVGAGEAIDGDIGQQLGTLPPADSPTPDFGLTRYVQNEPGADTGGEPPPPPPPEPPPEA